MVVHRSVFLKLTVFGKAIEAVCDSGASVSCVSSVVFDKFQKLGKLKFLPTVTKLVAANKLPITSRGTVRLTITIGLKHYEHEFQVLIDSEADCFVGLNFLRTNKRDSLFSKDLLRLDSKNQVPLYNRKLNHEVKTVFRVTAVETIAVQAGHAMILPARIQEWQRLFEQVERISTVKNAVVPSVFFKFAEENVSVTIENTGDEVITVCENTTLGTSEFFPKQTLNHIGSAPPRPKTNEVDESYDLKHVIDSISPAIPIKMRHKFAELLREFADFFSKNQWDIGKCDAKSHKIDVYQGSQPIKLSNGRLPLHFKQDLRETIDSFPDKELIMPCQSPYRAPTMLVPKKIGKLRLAIDYRQLNRQTIKSCWPIQSIEEVFDTSEGSAFVSMIDMS